MKYFFDIGNRYVKDSDWKDLALIKFCLFSMGIMLGTQLPKKNKNIAACIASGVFTATYIPLVAKLIRIMKSAGKG